MSNGSIGREDTNACANERWVVVHTELASIAKQKAALDAEEARWLREAEQLQIWKTFGMVSMVDYMEREVGYAPRTVTIACASHAPSATCPSSRRRSRAASSSTPRSASSFASRRHVPSPRGDRPRAARTCARSRSSSQVVDPVTCPTIRPMNKRVCIV